VGYSEGGECRHSEILTYYQDSQRIERCGHCDTCEPASLRKILKPQVSTLTLAKVSKRRRKKSSKTSSEDGLNQIESLRFSELKNWRKQKAKQLDIAAFMIFSDRTLLELATENPKSKASLLRIHGIGDAKLAAFGPDVLSLLNTL
ncbi:MAG: HRDC domain-containing protein, partial [Bdellovibrionales bacterium]